MTAATTLDATAVRALRTTAQGIGGWTSSGGVVGSDVGGDGVDIAGVARRMLALQGQDAPGVRWSLGLRAPGVTDAAVMAALADARVVRTWPMRRTLHLVHPADVRWLLGLTADRMLGGMAARRAALGITAADCARAVDATHEILEGRRALSRAAFLTALETRGVGTTGQRGYHLLAWVAISGHVVLGGDADGQPAILLADAWLPPTPPKDHDEALAELALRYVAGHGPASAADLARWAGLPVTEVRRGLAAAGDALETVVVDGDLAYVASGAIDALADPAASGGSTADSKRVAAAAQVHLLPGFDEYLLGYADRSAALASGHADRVVPGGNGMFRPTVLLDGQVVGTWARAVRAREVVVTAEPFPGAHVPDELLAAAAAAYGAFADRPVALRVVGGRDRRGPPPTSADDPSGGRADANGPTEVHAR